MQENLMIPLSDKDKETINDAYKDAMKSPNVDVSYQRFKEEMRKESLR